MTTELALDLPELLSARDVATLLKLTPRAVRLRMVGISPTLRDGICVWPMDALPADYQEQLRFARTTVTAAPL